MEKGKKLRVISLMLVMVLLFAVSVYGSGALTGTGKGDAASQGGREQLPRITSVDQIVKMVRTAQVNHYKYATEDIDVSDIEMESAAPDMAMENAVGGAGGAASGSAGSAGGVASADSSANDGAARKSSDGNGNYSETNSQVQGVDEGDLIKTDGQYLYVLRDSTVRIYEVNGGEMNLLSKIRLTDVNVEEMHLSGDRLVVAASKHIMKKYVSDTLEEKIAGVEMGDIELRYYYPSKSFTTYTVYDISDRKNPKETQTFELEGNSLATRLMDGKLYFAASQSIYLTGGSDEEDIVPLYRDSRAGGDYKALPLESICYFPENEYVDNIMMVGVMDLAGTGPAAVESYLNAGNDFYMNKESMYITQRIWETGGQKTFIYGFDLKGGVPEYRVKGEVNGYVLNQYSMDERDGYFRIAVTQNGKGNFIVTFDKNLKEQGRTPGLAPDETIQSVRFIGDMAYMVTYRQTDPLYAVDLSDPKNPQALDALKIPGFSQYLHPLGEDFLVGFGRHTTETYVRGNDGIERVVGTRDMGMKISLFDISDPHNLKEIDVMLLGENTYSEAFTNPRALMVHPGKNMFGFYYDDYSADESGIKLVSVTNGKLSELAEMELSYSYGSYNCRLAYIGDTIYGADAYGISAYSMTNFKEIGRTE